MSMRRWLCLFAAGCIAYSAADLRAHDVITTKVTFNREIIRLLNAHCNSCHREGGTAFSLETYKQARPWAKAIEEETLKRRMPPWGAVKGFGDFRNDTGLTAEQLELITDWEEGGAPEGEAKDFPAPPKFKAADAFAPHGAPVSGDQKLPRAVRLSGLFPKDVGDGQSVQITAELPDGSVEPLLWLETYKKAWAHPFLFRNPLDLPAGTVIRGVPKDALVYLLRATKK
jgi:hypothetical protein